MTLGGPVVGGAGVFAFDGPPEDTRGWSLGAQANAIVGGGFGVALPSGSILQFYGANNTVGLVVNGGRATLQEVNGSVVYTYEPSEFS